MSQFAGAGAKVLKSARTGGGLRFLAELVAIAVGYWLIAALSLRFASINPSATPIWPPTGLALGLTLLRGYRIWPAILAGAIAANIATSGWTALAIGAGNTAEAMIGAWLVNRLAGGVQAFRSPSGVGKFTAIVCVLATPVSATVGVLFLILSGHAAWPGFGQVWATWWLGDLAGAVVVTPALVLWATNPPEMALPTDRGAEAALVIALSAVVGLICLGPAPWVGASAVLAFVAVLPLLWAALRCGERDTATVALILSATAVWGAAAGGGPFIQPTQNGSFLLVVTFMVFAAAPSLALSAGASVRNRALASSEESRRLLLENLPDHAVFMLDTAGRVATWNSGAARVYGYTADQIVGQPVWDLQPDGEAGGLGDISALVLGSGKLALEGWRLRRDGSRFWASSMVSAIRDSDGRFVGLANITRDLTEQRRAQETLDRTREQLAQAQKLEALGRLTGGIAHDFNNLLMIIGGQADLLEGRLSEPRQLRATEAIRRAVERGASLTRRLLGFARRQTLTPEAIELPSRLTAMQEILRSSVGETVKVELDLGEAIWPVEVDLAELEMALINLAMNARDAMPDGGRLRISARNLAGQEGGLSGDFVEISLADTGVGMTPEVLEKAFDPFFSTKSELQGTGLGLSQVHGFATQSGGEVSAESQPGEGCTVTLRLPRAAGPAPAPLALVQRPAEASPPAGGSVLLVEDNPNVAETTAALLEALGYRVVHEANATDALDRLDAGERIDVVLSDVVMPGPLNGAGLARRLRDRLPVVLVTGYSDDAADADRAAVALLHKPFDAKSLASALAGALAGRT
ncbi:MAG TPA: MASE1 domain-containing protein, partial [Caulobacteraceae bacterium]